MLQPIASRCCGAMTNASAVFAPRARATNNRSMLNRAVTASPPLEITRHANVFQPLGSVVGSRCLLASLSFLYLSLLLLLAGSSAWQSGFRKTEGGILSEGGRNRTNATGAPLGEGTALEASRHQGPGGATTQSSESTTTRKEKLILTRYA